MSLLSLFITKCCHTDRSIQLHQLLAFPRVMESFKLYHDFHWLCSSDAAATLLNTAG